MKRRLISSYHIDGERPVAVASQKSEPIDRRLGGSCRIGDQRSRQGLGFEYGLVSPQKSQGKRALQTRPRYRRGWW